MWRPKKWAGLKGLHTCSDCYCLARARDSGRRRDYEAGADAMLEALKKRGGYLNGDTVIPARGEFPEIHCPGGMVGWLVFIPNEEDDGVSANS